MKHFLMTVLWRIQQSQGLIAPLFYAATLTGVFWPTVGTYLVGHGYLKSSQVALGLIVLFVSMLLIITAIGLVYDRVFKLWREQVEVGVEKNPYYQERLSPKEIVLWKRMHLRTLQQVANNDPGAEVDVQFMDRWIERSLADPRVRDQVEILERWIEGATPLPAPQSAAEGGGALTPPAATRRDSR